MFFHSWFSLERTFIVSAVIFVVTVGMLRFAGQQALARMSAYDMIVTVTLGSIVAGVAVTKDFPVADALAAMVTLLVLQELTRWLQSRFMVMHHAVREPPRVLVWDGEILEHRLRESHISGDEIRAVIRRRGLVSVSQVRVVVLENDGEWSVIAKSDEPSDESALSGLPIPGRSDIPEDELNATVPPDRVP